VSQNGIEFGLAQTDAGLRLTVLADSALAAFDGKRSELGGRTLNLCALTPKKTAALRNAPVTVCLDAQNNVTFLYKGKPLNYTIFHQQAKQVKSYMPNKSTSLSKTSAKPISLLLTTPGARASLPPFLSKMSLKETSLLRAIRGHFYLSLTQSCI